MKSIVVRNTLVKIIEVIGIFIFVKEQSDLWKYCIILSLSDLLGQVIMWFNVKYKIIFINLI